jgi:hypothetical protein
LKVVLALIFVLVVLAFLAFKVVGLLLEERFGDGYCEEYDDVVVVVVAG